MDWTNVLGPCGALLLLAWLILRRGRAATPVAPPLPRRAPSVSLDQLQAEGRTRLQWMQGCRMDWLAQAPGSPESEAVQCPTRSLPGRWLQLSLRVIPPTEAAQWWPEGVVFECPEFLRQRDALPPAQDQGLGLERALHLRLLAYPQKSPSCQGSQELSWQVYVPDQCLELEVGYYGVPCLLLRRPDPHQEFSPSPQSFSDNS